MRLLAHGMSDVGRRRDTNEDAYVLDPGIGLFAVADGMGGHAAGEVAAQLAIQTLRDVLGRIDGEEGSKGEDLSAKLHAAVLEANRRIFESILQHEERRGMGTTLVALLAAGERAVIGHVGDSRAYLLRGRQLHRLTADHSWVHEQVRMGLLTEDAAERHPMRNIITRALGSRTTVSADLTEQRLEAGDVLLLCSDGLNTMVADEAIRDLLAAHAHDPHAACGALVAAANDQGGEDNTTVIVARVVAAGRDPR